MIEKQWNMLSLIKFNLVKVKLICLFFSLICASFSLSGQIKIGSVNSEVNFREGPGTNFKIMHTINSSNLLVILPGKINNGFVEAFDVETSSHGYIYESLISVTDTLKSQKQNFFERAAENETGDIELDLINKTDRTIFIWINNNSYYLDPREKKILVISEENITYFSSTPGLYPVVGREILIKGNTYQWNITQ